MQCILSHSKAYLLASVLFQYVCTSLGLCSACSQIAGKQNVYLAEKCKVHTYCIRDNRDVIKEGWINKLYCEYCLLFFLPFGTGQEMDTHKQNIKVDFGYNLKNIQFTDY